ncbi:unnamed protein product [Rhizoctonia solani]|uniref:F-box domain-containing protein n=1 Tax=Rhizoctonia solani TaxID=456999 RepID=A0A8H3HSU4_9AGAM|nr:unnamed protein product [Rhizoctonia solani]CAE6536430.1 unnamed protein product [Rhizoctonia solani]
MLSMSSTTASDSLENMKRKRTEEDIEELPGCLENNNDSVQDTPQQEEDEVPSRKRQRAATPPTGVEPEQGTHDIIPSLLNIPNELFTKITLFLLPNDIISLARSNKLLRSIFMSRSSISIWRNSMKNVENIPPCPKGVSEPYYLAFLFTKECSLCGHTAAVQVDTGIIVRLCSPCRRECIMPLHLGVGHLGRLIPILQGSAESYGAMPFVLGRDFLRTLAEYQEKMRAHDSTAMIDWIKEKQADVAERRKLALVVSQFLVDQDSRIMRERYNEQVTQPMSYEPANTRCRALCRLLWAELLPKLIPLLEGNREHCLILDRKLRKQQRRLSLLRLYWMMRNHIEKDSARLTFETPTPWLPKPTQFLSSLYPGFEQMLELPVVKELYEADITGEALEASFEERWEEIELLVTRCKNGIYARFMEILRDSPEAQGLALVSGASEADSGPVSSTPEGLRLLFRADSLFYDTTARVKRPMSYNTIYAEAGTVREEQALGILKPIFDSSFGRMGPIHQSVLTPKTLDLSHIARYPEAQQVAMELLTSMGDPNATYHDIGGIRRVYWCGRCDNTGYMGWEQLVQHYIEERQLFNAPGGRPPPRFYGPIMYEDVHSSAFQTDRPLVKTVRTGSH